MSQLHITLEVGLGAVNPQRYIWGILASATRRRTEDARAVHGVCMRTPLFPSLKLWISNRAFGLDAVVSAPFRA